MAEDKTYKQLAWEEIKKVKADTQKLFTDIRSKAIDLQTAKELNYSNRSEVIETGQMVRLAPLMD